MKIPEISSHGQFTNFTKALIKNYLQFTGKKLLWLSSPEVCIRITDDNYRRQLIFQL